MKGFEFYSPAFSHKKLFTQTVFIPNSTQAVTGTQDGFIVVWDISLIMVKFLYIMIDINNKNKLLRKIIPNPKREEL